MNLETEIVQLIKDNSDLIEYKNNQIIIIPKALKNGIYELLQESQNKNFDEKDMIKSAVKKVLKLKESDIIVLKHKHIFIKIFNEANRNKVPASEANTIAGRFNGIDESELDDFYDEYFSKEESENFFNSIVKQFVEIYFIEEKIDNNIYEKNVFGAIQELVMAQLLNDFDYSVEFLKGFSGYIFRIHFNEVFESIAEFMLNEISSSNDYIIDFLKYYSLDIVILNGVKYKVPELETGNGLKWNVISMLSIAKIYTRTRNAIKVSKQQIKELDEKIMEFFINGLSPVEYNNIFIKEKQKLTEQLRKENQKLEKHHDFFKINKDEKKKDILNHDINVIKKEINGIRKKKEQLAQKEVKTTVLEKYKKLEREMDTLLRELKAQDKILTQNEKSYISIKKSLLKALISKKQRI